MIRAIIFDYYGVMCPRIVPCLSQKTAEQFNFNEKKVRPIMDELLDRMDEDKLSFKDYWKSLKSKFKNKETKLPDHHKIWKSCALGLDIWPKMVNLVKKLKRQGYIVPVLTNVTKSMVKYNRMKGRYKLFKPVFLSCYIGLRKPSPAIFRYVLKKMKLKPNECIFIDDNKTYLRGARTAGIKTVLFKNYSQTVDELRRYGINGI